MVKAVTLLLPFVSLVSGELNHWCGGLGFQDTNFNEKDDIDVIWAQAALFSANNGSQALGRISLFHTALIFQQGDVAYTLEFDNTANGDDAAPAGAGYYPTFIEDSDTGNTSLIWEHGAARWCMTEGILWGVDHWKKSYKVIGSIQRSLFFDIDTDLIGPTNSSDPMASPLYNMWHVAFRVPQDMQVMSDVTCGNGAVWVRDYLQGKGANLTLGQHVTRVEINVEDTDTEPGVARVGPMDAEWEDVVAFYKGLEKLFAGSSNVIDKMLAMFASLPLKYVYDLNNETHPYLKLVSSSTLLPERIRYKKAPEPWGPIPGPAGPIPAPPAPPRPPVPAGPLFGKPDVYLRCQPGEELLQVPIIDGTIARVCAPQCSGGGPDGTCPDASSFAPGYWKTPNCNNPDSQIPVNDCVLRCGGLFPNNQCDTGGGAECFLADEFGGGLLGVCMYAMMDDDISVGVVRGAAYRLQNASQLEV